MSSALLPLPGLSFTTAKHSAVLLGRGSFEFLPPNLKAEYYRKHHSAFRLAIDVAMLRLSYLSFVISLKGERERVFP
eukprot:7861823-Pyramimonas_sp.AAC.1